ncbi:MAG: UDP-3-O-(3-hydroxymyristoyl)glucosamine N-acyltransferase [Pseudomonadota bacterium]
MSLRFTLGELADQLGAELVGLPELSIDGLGSLATAQATQLSHLSNPAYKSQLAETKAGAVLIKAEDRDACPVAALVVANPYLAFARATQLFAGQRRQPAGVHASAVIGDDSQIHTTAHIGPNVVIGARTVVEAGAQILANTVVGDDCHVAEDVLLHPRVSIQNRVHLGTRTEIHSGAVIGADGFGFTPDEQGRWQAIAQLGGVRIGADVSIGANTCIDCGAIEDTVVEEGVKIDNQVQIGHNCHIGAHTLLCGMVGLAGSTRIGRHCVFAGRSGAGGDHPIEVCDGVIVSSCTVLSQSVSKPGTYSGSMLFHEHGLWRRNALRFASLDSLFKRVKRLEKQTPPAADK